MADPDRFSHSSVGESFDPYMRWLGISDPQSPPNHYRLVGIELYENDGGIIDSAADRQMLLVRRFQVGKYSVQSQRLLTEISRARVVLCDPTKKAAYDRELHEQHERGDAKSHAASVKLQPILTGPRMRGKLVNQPLGDRRRPKVAVLGLVTTVATISMLVIAFVANFTAAASYRQQAVLATYRLAIPKSDKKDEVAKFTTRNDAPGSNRRLDRKTLESPSHRQSSTDPKGDISPSDDRQEGSKQVQSSSREKNVDTRTTDPAYENPFGSPPKTDRKLPEKPSATPVGAESRQGGELSGFLIGSKSETKKPSRRPLTSDCSMKPAVIIDDADKLFSASGSWERASKKEAYRGAQAHLQGGRKGTAIWKIPVAPGRYQVSVTWPPMANRTKQAQYTISGIVGGNKEFVINQELAPSSNDGSSFQNLGTDVSVKGKSLSVTLKHHRTLDAGDRTGTNSFLIADAIRIKCIGLSGRMNDPIDLIPSDNKWTLPVPRDTGKLLLGDTTKPDGDSRFDMPSEAEIAKRQKQIREIYSKEYAAAVRRENKVIFARTLLSDSKSTSDDLASHYVLLREALAFALEGRDAGLCMSVIEQLEKTYRIDGMAESFDALETISKHVSSNSEATNVGLLEMTDKAIRKSVASEEFKRAIGLVRLGVTVAYKLRDTETRDRMVVAGKNVLGMQLYFESAMAGVKVLRSNPNDAAANLSVGKYICFVKNQWDKGLPFLAKGNNALLARIAKQDLDDPGSGRAVMILANEWWKQSESYRGLVEQSILNRAAFWYRRAVPELTGLDKKQAVTRIEEAERKTIRSR